LLAQNANPYQSVNNIKLLKKNNISFFKNKKFDQLEVADLFGENRKNLRTHPKDIKDIYNEKKYKTFNFLLPLWSFSPKTTYVFSPFYFNSNLDLITNVFESLNTTYLKSFDYTKLPYYDDISLPSIPYETLETCATSDVASSYSHLRRVSFIDFFINYAIDVPICFKKSPSLKSINSQLPLLKFANLLTRSGKRESLFRILFLAIRLLSNKNQSTFNTTCAISNS